MKLRIRYDGNSFDINLYMFCNIVSVKKDRSCASQYKPIKMNKLSKYSFILKLNCLIF